LPEKDSNTTETNEKMLIENDSSTMNKSEIEINQREVESNFKVNTIQE